MYDIRHINPFLTTVQQAWTKETSRCPNIWTPQKRYKGQDDVSALLIADYIGGQLISYPISDNERHFFNYISNQYVLDPAEDTDLEYSLENYKDFIIPKTYLYTSEDIMHRYEILVHVFFSILERTYPDISISNSGAQA